MSCGAEHSIGLSDKGVMYAWGWGSYGNLGDGERVDRWAPVRVRMHACLHVQGARLFFCFALGPWQHFAMICMLLLPIASMHATVDHPAHACLPFENSSTQDATCVLCFLKRPEMPALACEFFLSVRFSTTHTFRDTTALCSPSRNFSMPFMRSDQVLPSCRYLE